MPRRPVVVRALIATSIAVSTFGAPARAVAAPAPWIQDIGSAVNGHDVSVAIGFDGGWLYRHGARTRRPPASNEKLLFSMTLLSHSALETRLRTRVFATAAPAAGLLRGDLWIVGHGDPEVGKAVIATLARAIREAGIRRVRGHVMGATTGFSRDWWAPGWRDYFPKDYIPLPTALTFEGNRDARGVHITDPERRAARSLTNRLRAIGVRVSEDPGAGVPPSTLRPIAGTTSAPFRVLLRRMNRRSRNFYAEVLGKWLGGRVLGGAGSIAKAARAIELFGEHRGVSIVAYDASGLSYRNRVRAEDVVELLWFAAGRPWGDELRFTLPSGGKGTLEGRLADVKVRAKTGTLEEVSALSGWVWMQKAGAWGEFSIMSQGMHKSEAVAIEDRIVRILANRASP